MDGRHGPAEPELNVPYPGGKNGWTRVRCVAEDCDYVAWEAPPAGRALRRVEAHAAAKNANEAARERS